MGNQARQSQEIELWPMMGSSGNGQTRRANARRTDMQERDNVPRGQMHVIDPNVPRSTYRKGSTGRTYYTSGTRGGRVGTERVYASGTRGGRTGMEHSNVSRMRSGRTAAGASRTSARAVRTVYAEPGRRRPNSSRTKAGAQTSKKKKAGRRARTAQIFAVMWIMAMTLVIFFMGRIFLANMQRSPAVKADKPKQISVEDTFAEDNSSNIKMPKIQEDFLTISEYNRPGTELASVKNIFVHYTANPGTSAAQNRSYFESLGQTHERAASAHFIIGYEGEVVQCIPLDEEAYAVIERNGDSISIECCYLEKNGAFTQETYDTLIAMLAWLTDKYDLEPKDILRHYDCGGKKCPLYYVEHEDEWQKLLEDVANYTL